MEDVVFYTLVAIFCGIILYIIFWIVLTRILSNIMTLMMFAVQ